MIHQVNLRAVERDLIKTPKALVIKFQKWVDDIETFGLEEVRKVRGWHDHALKGDRLSQRAIYLQKMACSLCDTRNRSKSCKGHRGASA